MKNETTDLSGGAASSHASIRDPREWRTLFLFAIAWAAGLMYALTAHLTSGHRADFGREWMAGRLIVSGQGRFLYDPVHQEAVLRTCLDSGEITKMRMAGIDYLTYPPVQGLVYAPLGALPPETAQWWVVELSLVAVVLAGFALSRSTSGAVSTSAVVLSVLLQPAFLYNVGLGQNAAITLALMIGGWSLWKQGHAQAAGIVWGCLAYKPTWGLAVCWIPLMLGQPRAYVGMFLSAATLTLLTIPVCGIGAWISWFEVAHRVESGYSEVLKWEWMRRDLTGLMNQSFGQTPPMWGWVGLTAVVAVTAIVWRQSKSNPHDPTRDALILSAIVLSCPRFMFYDILMATPAMLVALSGWNDLTTGARIVLSALILAYFAAWPLGFGVWPWFWPVETASILGIWLWCLWQLILRCTIAGRNSASASQSAPECSGSNGSLARFTQAGNADCCISDAAPAVG